MNSMSVVCLSYYVQVCPLTSPLTWLPAQDIVGFWPENQAPWLVMGSWSVGW